MKQLKPFLFLTLAISVFFASCSKDKNNIQPPQVFDEASIASFTPPTGYCGSSTFTLLAGQTINVGTITVGNDATNLYVTYDVTAPYIITETHLYVGSLSDLPVTNSGNAIPGQFPYNNSHNPGVTTFTVTIPLASLSNLGGCNVIAAHSVVRNATGYSNFNQTGWISGTRINNGGNWAMYNTFCNASCVELPPEK